MVRDRPYVNGELTGTHGWAIELAHPDPHVFQTEYKSVNRRPQIEHIMWGRRAPSLITIVVMTLFIKTKLVHSRQLATWPRAIFIGFQKQPSRKLIGRMLQTLVDEGGRRISAVYLP